MVRTVAALAPGEPRPRAATPLPTPRASVPGVSSTRVSHHLKAPRERVFRVLIDAEAIAAWKVPTGTMRTATRFRGGLGEPGRAPA